MNSMKQVKIIPANGCHHKRIGTKNVLDYVKSPDLIKIFVDFLYATNKLVEINTDSKFGRLKVWEVHTCIFASTNH